MKSDRAITRVSRRLFRLCLTGGDIDEAKVRKVARRLAASDRRESHAVLAAFLRLVRLKIESRAAVVESAVPLPIELREIVSGNLSGLYGPATRPTFTVNPDLLGGVRIKVGSDVYDGSVRARLAALAARL